MMSISVEAAAARESLSDDKEIVNTYEVAWVLFLCIPEFFWLPHFVYVSEWW